MRAASCRQTLRGKAPSASGVILTSTSVHRSRVKIFCMALSGWGIIITYPDGRFVSLHTVCSLILPSDHNGGNTHPWRLNQTTIPTTHLAVTQTRRAARHCDREWMTLCVYAQVTSCDETTTSSTTSAQVAASQTAATLGVSPLRSIPAVPCLFLWVEADRQ